MPRRSIGAAAYREAMPMREANGMALTVLSAMARQDVDPWQEALELSNLPGETAIHRLTTRLGNIPGDASLSERTLIAQRLWRLLPCPETPPNLRLTLGRVPQGIRRITSSELGMVIVYLGLMCVGEWIFAASMEAPPPVAAATHAPVRE